MDLNSRWIYFPKIKVQMSFNKHDSTLTLFSCVHFVLCSILIW